MATVGTVVVLYVLSFAPALSYAMHYNGMRDIDAWLKSGGIVYRPVVWIYGYSRTFRQLYAPYGQFCFELLKRDDKNRGAGRCMYAQ